MHFPDPADRASHEEQVALGANIRAALRKQNAPLAAIGKCYNCDEPFEEGSGLRFCDEDCRDDYDHRVTRRRVNGALH